MSNADMSHKNNLYVGDMSALPVDKSHISRLGLVFALVSPAYTKQECGGLWTCVYLCENLVFACLFFC